LSEDVERRIGNNLAGQNFDVLNPPERCSVIQFHIVTISMLCELLQISSPHLCHLSLACIYDDEKHGFDRNNFYVEILESAPMGASGLNYWGKCGFTAKIAHISIHCSHPSQIMGVIPPAPAVPNFC